MKIAIIGGGNVGRTLGVKLDILSHDVTIVESNLPKTIPHIFILAHNKICVNKLLQNGKK